MILERKMYFLLPKIADFVIHSINPTRRSTAFRINERIKFKSAGAYRFPRSDTTEWMNYLISQSWKRGISALKRCFSLCLNPQRGWQHAFLTFPTNLPSHKHNKRVLTTAMSTKAGKRRSVSQSCTQPLFFFLAQKVLSQLLNHLRD